MFALFRAIPPWRSLTDCEKVGMLLADIGYSCITLGLPILVSVVMGSVIQFFGIAAVETACDIPPTIPGVLTFCSIFKAERAGDMEEPLNTVTIDSPEIGM